VTRVAMTADGKHAAFSVVRAHSTLYVIEGLE